MIKTLDIHLNNKSVPLIKLPDVRSVEPSDFSDFRPLIAVRTSQFVMIRNDLCFALNHSIYSAQIFKFST